VSRRYRLPFLRANGFPSATSRGGASLEVTCVSPLDAVLLEMLLDRPAASPLAAAAACESAIEFACLLLELPVEDEVRFACARACAWARFFVD
jgi:hypothetical protein